MKVKWLSLLLLVPVVVLALSAGATAEDAGSLPLSMPEDTPTPHWQIVRLQQGVDGYTGCQDTWLDGWDREATHGTDALITVRSTNHQVALIRFDLEGVVPEDARIIEAMLYLYSVDQTTQGSMVLAAHGVYRNWSEAEANWLRASKVDDWGEPGCNDSAADRAENPYSMVEVAGTGFWVGLDVTGLVQGSAADPAVNTGINLRGIGPISMRHRFATADHWEESWHPRLKVIWIEPGGPGPTYTPYPTYTPFPTLPTYTPYPTYTPVPTDTPTVTPTQVPPMYLPLMYKADTRLPFQ